MQKETFHPFSWKITNRKCCTVRNAKLLYYIFVMVNCINSKVTERSHLQTDCGSSVKLICQTPPESIQTIHHTLQWCMAEYMLSFLTQLLVNNLKNKVAGIVVQSFFLSAGCLTKDFSLQCLVKTENSVSQAL